ANCSNSSFKAWLTRKFSWVFHSPMGASGLRLSDWEANRREISLCANRPIHRNESEKQRHRFVPFEMTVWEVGRGEGELRGKWEPATFSGSSHRCLQQGDFGQGRVGVTSTCASRFRR